MFGDLLDARVRARESQIVVGLDPDPNALWPVADSHPGSASVRVHCLAVIDAVEPACVAVKPQMACFERLGPTGWNVLERVVTYAQERGLLVIADGKRGDIAVTATAYGQALTRGIETPFGHTGGLGADLMTVNPLMGRDSLEPMIAAARAAGAGVLVLVRTSNAGASDVQDLLLRAGGTVWEHLALLVDDLGSTCVGEAGLADVGAVMGATQPTHLERARALMPRAFFLLPGVGAQGGRVEDLGPAFAPGPAGGLVTASRSIVDAYRVGSADPARAARAAAEDLRELAWGLA